MLIRIIIDLLIGAGLVFAVAGTIGIVKMPPAFPPSAFSVWRQAGSCMPH